MDKVKKHQKTQKHHWHINEIQMTYTVWTAGFCPVPAIFCINR